METEMLINECSPTGFNIKESFKEYLIEKSQPLKTVVQVWGDNMHPTIVHGSQVLAILVKKENWNAAESGVYAVIFKNQLVARKLNFVIGRLKENSLLERNKIVLHSDNEKHKPLTILVEDIKGILRVDRIVSQDVF
jgi:phage repressor protein C with HTH and peptisase S24 domain